MMGHTVQAIRASLMLMVAILAPVICGCRSWSPPGPGEPFAIVTCQQPRVFITWMDGYPRRYLPPEGYRVYPGRHDVCFYLHTASIPALWSECFQHIIFIVEEGMRYTISAEVSELNTKKRGSDEHSETSQGIEWIVRRDRIPGYCQQGSSH